jgi:hypothetical protein
MMHRQVQKPAPSESESNAPSETTEARSDRDKLVEEFLQRPVDPALLTALRSSGPPGCRARPSKEDKLKKVQFIPELSCARAQLRRARAPEPSSQAPPLTLEPVPDGHSRPRRACSQPEAKTVKRK